MHLFPLTLGTKEPADEAISTNSFREDTREMLLKISIMNNILSIK